MLFFKDNVNIEPHILPFLSKYQRSVFAVMMWSLTTNNWNWHVPLYYIMTMTITMTMKNIYLTINQQIAKYSCELLLLWVINWSGDHH